jgi:hypothetical protein
MAYAATGDRANAAAVRTILLRFIGSSPSEIRSAHPLGLRRLCPMTNI